jgi:hypothetical protein
MAERTGAGATLMRGAGELSLWRASGRVDGWRREGRTFVASGSRSVLSREFPELVGRPIVLDVGWRGEPRFRVGLGVRRAVGDDVTLEAWGDRLVAWREGERRIEHFVFPGSLADETHYVVRARILDREVVFLDADGEPIGGLSRGSGAGNTLQLVCDGLGLELRDLFVGGVSGGVLPKDLTVEAVTGFDGAAGELVTGDERVTLERLGLLTSQSVKIDPAVPESGGPQLVRIALRDGSTLFGPLDGLVDGRWRVRVPWSPAPIAVEAAAVAEVELHHHAVDLAQEQRSLGSSVSTRDGELSGLIAGIGANGQLVFQPALSTAPVGLDSAGVERITFGASSAFFVPTARFPHRLHLRSGESVRAKVTAIDRDRVTCATPWSETVTVPVGLVKAVELDLRSCQEYRRELTPEPPKEQDQQQIFIMGVPTQLPPRRYEAPFRQKSLDLALQLPRKHKQRPPSHLLVARNGDFLRARVLGWTSAGTAVEGRELTEEGEPVPQQLAAEAVAAIVWLAEDAEEAAADGPDGVLRGRLVVDAENQLEVTLTGTEGSRLRCRSAWLGEFEIERNQVLRLDVRGDRDPCFYSGWTLRPMPEPKLE